LPNLTTHTEKELLRLAADGNEAAFIEIFNLYKHKLYSFLLRITKSEEQSLDFVQDIFMKLWMNRISLSTIDNFSSYIFRAAQNQAVNSFKRSMTENYILKKNPVAEMASNSIEADLEYKLLQTKLNEVVKKLPPQQQLVYTLSREQGLKHEEIAKQLNLSVSTVKNHMVQALKTIKEFLRSNLEIDEVLLLIVCSCIFI
jgi:RNA polymerase sigma-70 factor (family 1)